MKEIKPIHIVIAIILVLSAIAIVQWMTLPKSGPPPVTELSEETGQTEELPVLPQNELNNSSAAPSFSEDIPPFEESRGQDIIEPKDPAVSNKKAEL